jgi:hypothetical protein
MILRQRSSRPFIPAHRSVPDGFVETVCAAGSGAFDLIELMKFFRVAAVIATFVIVGSGHAGLGLWN